MRYRRYNVRRNGTVIDFRTRRVLSDERINKVHEVAQYIADARRGRRGITVTQMSRDLGISPEDAERTLDGVASEGLLSVTRTVVRGDKIYTRPHQPTSEAEAREDRLRSQRVGEEARARAARVAKFSRDSVVVIRGGRRRYIVASVEPNYGGEQTYYLAALSGGEQGSAPSGVRESELTLAPSQEIRWEGAQAGKRYCKYAMASRMLGKSEPLPFKENPKKREPTIEYDREWCLHRADWQRRKAELYEERQRHGQHYCGGMYSVEETTARSHRVAEKLWMEAAHDIDKSWVDAKVKRRQIKRAEAASQDARDAESRYHDCMIEVEALKAKWAARQR